MEDCNTNECPDLEFSANYTCPNGGEAKPNGWNPEKKTTTAAPEPTTTTVTTTTTTTAIPTIKTDSAASVVPAICLLLSMILAI